MPLKKTLAEDIEDEGEKFVKQLEQRNLQDKAELGNAE
jgi:hypothetical protein